MSLTLDYIHDANGNIGQLRTQMIDVTFDDDYQEGGYSITGSDAGVGTFIYGAEEVASNSVGSLYRVQYNPDTYKLQVLGLTTHSENYTTSLDGSDNLAGTEGNADQAAGPTNFDLLFAGDDFGNLTDGEITPIDSPDVPRNVVITIENGTLGALDLFEGITTFLITGTDVNDAALTESVTLTSTVLNQAVAASKFRFIQGVKAFKTITNIVVTNLPDDDLTVYVGPGSRIGIPTPLQTPSYQDVTSLTVDATPVTPSDTTTDAGGIDVTNNTVNVGDVSDTDELVIDYNPSAEVVDGTNLSAVTKRIQFLGV